MRPLLTQPFGAMALLCQNGIEYSFSFHGGFMALIQCAIYVGKWGVAGTEKGKEGGDSQHHGRHQLNE